MKHKSLERYLSRCFLISMLTFSASGFAGDYEFLQQFFDSADSVSTADLPQGTTHLRGFCAVPPDETLFVAPYLKTVDFIFSRRDADIVLPAANFLELRVNELGISQYELVDSSGEIAGRHANRHFSGAILRRGSRDGNTVWVAQLPGARLSAWGAVWPFVKYCYASAIPVQP